MAHRLEGVLQVGTRMDVVNATQQTLLEVLLVGYCNRHRGRWPGSLVQQLSGTASIG